MKTKLYILFLLIVIFVAVSVVSARTSEPLLSLQPGQTAVVLCQDGSTPDISFLRIGGVRVSCIK